MIAKQKGTVDIKGNDALIWKYVNNTIDCMLENYNYEFIRTPVFEASELFHRSVGESSDIVKKGKNGKNLMKDSKSTIISGEKLKKSVKENVYYYISVDNINKVKSKEKILFKIVS